MKDLADVQREQANNHMRLCWNCANIQVNWEIFINADAPSHRGTLDVVQFLVTVTTLLIKM